MMAVDAATVAEALILTLICVVSVLGNCSLFLIVLRKRTLRTITNGFLLNLALADLLVSVFNMPVTVVTIIQQRWSFGQSACIVFGFITILCFIASVLSLSLIAINRYYFVVKWKIYPNIFTRSRAVLFACLVWVFSALLSIPPLFGWAEYRFIPGKSYCFVYWPSDIFFMYFMIGTCFFGPLFVMAVSYYNILTFTKNVRQRVMRDRQREQQEGRGSRRNPIGLFRLTPESKITNTFIIVVAFFIVCWAPFAVTMFFDVYWPRPLPRVIDIGSLLLGYLNSMCNPVLYGVRNQAFRKEFINLYKTCMPCLVNRRVFFSVGSTGVDGSSMSRVNDIPGAFTLWQREQASQITEHCPRVMDEF